jgi:hypothetical protein
MLLFIMLILQGFIYLPLFFSVSVMKSQANLPQSYNSVNCGGEVTGLDL